VIRAAVELLEQQEDIYNGKLGELQQAAQIGWEASQRGEVVDENIAMEQIRKNIQSRYPKQNFSTKRRSRVPIKGTPTSYL
jgi:antitoxin ParD1/3/4